VPIPDSGFAFDLIAKRATLSLHKKLPKSARLKLEPNVVCVEDGVAVVHVTATDPDVLLTLVIDAVADTVYGFHGQLAPQLALTSDSMIFSGTASMYFQ